MPPRTRVTSGLTWEPQLKYRRGARDRLCGIRVFHDFNWRDVFPDQRTQFKHGKDLARTVIEECPSTHTPAILLTRRTDVQEGFRLTDTHLLFVVNIDEYRRSQSNPALSYLAGHLRVDISQLHGYTDLADLGDPDELRRVIGQHLTIEDVASWAIEDPARVDSILEALGRTAARRESDDDTQTDATTANESKLLVTQNALDMLAALSHLDEDQASQLIELTTRLTREERRLDLLRGATFDESGRRLAAQVVQERATDRIDDARRALERFEALLAADGTSETDMQRYLAKNPLIFGLQYSSTRDQVEGPSGSMDFLLERLDGYHDLVELKGPGEPLIVAPARPPGTKLPSPHTFRLSAALSQAIAQALAYRERLTRHPHTAEEIYGIPNARYPRLLIVLGRTENLDAHKMDVLRELNRMMHRVHILDYDTLARQARQTLANILKYLEHPASSLERSGSISTPADVHPGDVNT